MQEGNPTKIYREFGLFVGILFPVLIGWIIPNLLGHNFRSWTLLIGFPLFILGVFAPKRLHYPYKIWIKIGYFLGFINSRIILGIIFYFLLFPLSMIMKLGGYDPLRKKKNSSESYREIRKNDNIDLNKIF